MPMSELPGATQCHEKMDCMWLSFPNESPPLAEGAEVTDFFFKHMGLNPRMSNMGGFGPDASLLRTRS